MFSIVEQRQTLACGRLLSRPSDPRTTGRSAGRCNTDNRACWGERSAGDHGVCTEKPKRSACAGLAQAFLAFSPTLESHHPRSRTAA